jgi:hypothetical protein
MIGLSGYFRLRRRDLADDSPSGPKKQKASTSWRKRRTQESLGLIIRLSGDLSSNKLLHRRWWNAQPQAELERGDAGDGIAVGDDTEGPVPPARIAEKEGQSISRGRRTHTNEKFEVARDAEIALHHGDVFRI